MDVSDAVLSAVERLGVRPWRAYYLFCILFTTVKESSVAETDPSMH